MTLSLRISAPAVRRSVQAWRALPTVIALTAIVLTVAAWYLILDMALSALR
jgi:multisubunit Na+/H+ antiporter MnhC subunit